MSATAIQLPEVRTLQAAIGWIELGLPREALHELDALPEHLLRHPDALEVRFLILSDLKDWDAAVLVTQQLIEVAGERATSWLHHAYSTRRASTGGLPAAFQVLSSVAANFPKEPTIPYNLACYACQLGRGAVETLDWFERALQVGNRKELIAMALRDADLEPVWPLIRQKSPAHASQKL